MTPPSPLPPATCVDLQLQSCSDVAYNRTAFPTLLQHRSRAAVESSPEYVLLSVLHHLLEGQCNPDLRLLGCAVLAPRCEGGRLRRPCRHVCGALREACQPAFDAIDMAWPYFLDCGRYFSGPEEDCYDPLEKLRGGFRGLPAVVSGWVAGRAHRTRVGRAVPRPRQRPWVQEPGWEGRDVRGLSPGWHSPAHQRTVGYWCGGACPS